MQQVMYTNCSLEKQMILNRQYLVYQVRYTFLRSAHKHQGCLRAELQISAIVLSVHCCTRIHKQFDKLYTLQLIKQRECTLCLTIGGTLRIGQQMGNRCQHYSSICSTLQHFPHSLWELNHSRADHTQPIGTDQELMIPAAESLQKYCRFVFPVLCARLNNISLKVSFESYVHIHRVAPLVAP